MDLRRLQRVRWAVRGTLVLGVAASVIANVLHARDNPISQAIAAWPPLALLLTVELISRVPVHRRALAAARLIATAIIAGIAAWVSYWHMAGVAARYGEVGASPYLLPLSVDGLIVVASICLVELSGRITATEPAPAAASTTPAATAPPAPLPDVPAQPTPTARDVPAPVAGERGPATAVPATAATGGGGTTTDPSDTAPSSGSDPAPAASHQAPAPTGRPAGPDPVPATRPDPDATSDPDATGAPPAAPPPPQRRPAEPVSPPMPVGAGASPRPRASQPSPTGARAAAHATSTAVAYPLDNPDPAEGDPTVALSLRERVFQLLDREITATDTRRPPQIADVLLPQLPDVDRDTVARYVRLWRTEVAAGRRGTGGRLRSVPSQG